jgi:hypothetical protein
MSATINTGSEGATSYLDAISIDGSSHDIVDSGDTISVDYTFDIGNNGLPIELKLTAYLNDNADQIEVYAYNYVGSTYEQIGIIEGKNGSTFDEYRPQLFTRNVGTGSSVGEVNIRFVNAGTTPSQLSVEQIAIAYTLSPQGIANNSTITLSATTNNANLVGNGWILDLNGQDIGGSYFYGAKSVTGIGTGTTPVFDRCLFGTVTLPPCVIAYSVFTGTLTAGSAGNYLIANCDSAVPGESAPAFDFSGQGSATTASFRKWSGGITVTVDSDCVVSIDAISGGTVTVNGTGGTVHVRGMVAVVDGSSGAVTIVQTQAISNPSINAEVDTAISDAALATAAQGTDIQSRLPAALVNSRMDSTIDDTGMEAGAVAAIAFAILEYFGATLGTVEDDAGNSASVFQTSMAETADDYYVGSALVFTSGTNANQVRKITAYAGSTGTITVSPAFDAEPGTDQFTIVGRIE